MENSGRMVGVGARFCTFLVSLVIWAVLAGSSGTSINYVAVKIHDKVKISKKEARVIGSVVRDVVDSEGRVLIPRGSPVYAILRVNKNLKMTYIEFLYVEVGGRKIPVRGYAISHHPETLDEYPELWLALPSH